MATEASPLGPVLPVKGTNFHQTVFNMINCFVGAGILTMPFAFRLAGYVGASIALLLVSLLSWYAAVLLGKALEIAVELRPDMREKDVSALGEVAFGRNGKVAIRMLFAAELWFALETFLILTGVNMHIATGLPRSGVVVAAGLLGSASLWLPLSIISDLSLLSILCLLAGLLSLVAYGVSHATTTTVPHPHMLMDPWSMPCAGSICLYCLSGLPCLPTIRGGMEDKRAYFTAINISFMFATLYYAAIGLLAYYFFGDSIRESFTVNLAAGSAHETELGSGKTSMTFALVSAGLFATKLQAGFPLYATPVLEALGFSGDSPENRDKKQQVTSARMVFALLSISFAIFAQKRLAFIAGLMGSFLTCSTSIVFPALAFLSLHRTMGKPMDRTTRAAASSMVALGVTFMVVGTAFAWRRLLSVESSGSIHHTWQNPVAPHAVASLQQE